MINPSIKKRVAIIGAGMAGLTCAHELAKSGFDVHVFEKSKGVGGRMSHRYYEEWEADHGAQYFTVKDQLFAARLTEWMNAGVVAEWGGKIVEFDSGSIHPPSGAGCTGGQRCQTTHLQFASCALALATCAALLWW